MSKTTVQSLYLTSSQWILTQSTKLSQIYTMESEHTQINLNDGKLEISWGKSKNTDFLEKYRPFLTIFLRKSVLQTKIIYIDQVVITAIVTKGGNFLVLSNIQKGSYI